MKHYSSHALNHIGQILPKILTLAIVGALVCLCPLNSNAQGDLGACNFSANANIGCNGLFVNFSANPSWPTHQWDFGDGSPIVSGGQSLYQISHTYIDFNPFKNPLPIAKHRLDSNSPWCEKEVQEFMPGITIGGSTTGTACGSTRLISALVTAGVIPANELVGKNLFLYGNLEVDVSYIFSGCNIFVSDGGTITIKANATLTLNNNSTLDANTGAGICPNLWNGIEVLPGGVLVTNDATIQNAHYAISLNNPSNLNPLPRLSLQNTIFRRNFVGIYAAKGRFAISSFLNNTFEGAGDTDIYEASICNPPAPIGGTAYLRRTYCGIYFDGTMGGTLLLAGQSLGNTFLDMQAGIVCLNGTARISGCRFDNIRFLPAKPALHQGTAITFIDNIGGKRLSLLGLGKDNLLPTINNCERGVYSLTSKPLTEVSVSSCRILEVQNGVEMTETGAGNIVSGSVTGCYIGCSQYLPVPNIKQRSTGVEIQDPNIAFSNFNISDNTIDVDQPEAYSPVGELDENILPRGIGVLAMHNQVSGAAMALSVGNNFIDLIRGAQGIVLTNTANASVANNQIYHDLSTLDGNADLVGVYFIGGIDNTAACNSVYQTNSNGAYFTGLACMSSPNIIMSQNNVEDALGGISFVSDNGTDCIVSYNNLSFSLEIPNFTSTGIFYRDARTGPQHFQDDHPEILDEEGYGNDWLGDLRYGAWFLGTELSYCESRYYVSPNANVANATNPVDQGQAQNCLTGPDTWFTVLEVQEDDYTCGGAGGGGVTLSKNEADLNLANGGTLNLSPGFRWTSEMGLIRKFTENPALAAGDAVINGFLQAQQSQPVAAMYGVRNGINGLEGSIPSSTLGNIQNTMAQVGAIEANLLALLPQLEANPNALASFTTLNAQAEALEQSLQSYMTSALNSMATNATAVRNANNGINASVLPCSAEQYLNGLYLETQFITPRALSPTELEAVRQIGLYCPNDAGNIVYLARAWYYLQTGTMVYGDCGSFMPPTSGSERSGQLPSAPVGELVLMPNPADGSVAVLIPTNMGESTLVITDLWGRLLLQRKIPDSGEPVVLEIPLEGFVNGIYLVSVKEKNGKPIVKRLTIAH